MAAALLLCLCLPTALAQDPPHRPRPFGIQVVDRDTGRGVPLVQLRTVHGIRYWTDNGGWVAFDEPGLLGRRVWFFVESDGYEHPADGFGYRGVALDTRPGGRARIQVDRLLPAERLYRTTGQGLYRDSLLLGEPVPLRQPLLNGGVLGQDSVVAVPFRGRILWFWGDTNRAAYPLGLFEVAGAWSLPPGAGGLQPSQGVDLHYFTGPDGFARAMCPIEGPGPVWIFGAMVFQEEGEEQLYAYYSRHKSLGEIYEHGIVRWNPEREIFEKWREFPLQAELHPGGQTLRVREAGREWFVFPVPYPQVRVEARPDAIGDPDAYEAFTCLEPGSSWDPMAAAVERDQEGNPVWGWKRATAPVDEKREEELVRRGLLREQERLARLHDAETGDPVRAHNGAIHWNPWRGKWVWILNETFGRSFLGEVWYAEAPTLLGPWTWAVRIVTHEDYSFYNVAWHPFFLEAGGRILYFEGTYTRAFSGAEVATPRYDYNQITWRLDLADPRLHPREEDLPPLPERVQVLSPARPLPGS